jgi:hypothetical protein
MHEELGFDASIVEKDNAGNHCNKHVESCASEREAFTRVIVFNKQNRHEQTIGLSGPVNVRG